MPLLSFAAMLLMRKRVKITDIEVPEYAVKNEQIRLTVSVKNTGKLPVIYSEVKINYILFDKNIDFLSESKVDIAIKPGVTKQIVLKTSIPHYALSQIKVEKIKIRDYLGLFHYTIRIDMQPKGINIHLNENENAPNVKQIPVIPFVSGNYEDDDTNSDIISLGDVDEWETQVTTVFSNSGEFEGIREYRPGDTRNRIHQKLSAKSDLVLVKEYNENEYPPILLMINLKSKGDEPLDTLIDNFVETARVFIHKQIPFYAVNYGYDYETHRIDSNGDLKKLLINLIRSVFTSEYNEYISDGIPQQFNIIYAFPEVKEDAREESV
jgi:hypothetical protein